MLHQDQGSEFAIVIPQNNYKFLSIIFNFFYEVELWILT